MKKLLFCLMGITALAILAIPLHFHIINSFSKNIDPRVQPYYESFVKEARKHGRDVSQIGIIIKFTQIEKPNGILVVEGETTLGQCDVIFGQQPSIKINQTQWNSLSEVKKEWTIFHELGHCFLLKGHTNGVANFHHKSIMNRLAFSDYEYQTRREEYLNELFSYEPYHVVDYIQTFFILPAADRLYSYQKKIKVAANIH